MKIDRKIAIKRLIVTVGVILAIPVIYNIIMNEYFKEENQASLWAMMLGYILAMSLLVVAFLPSFNIAKHFQKDKSRG
jgi:ABC-type bacteriocin/lantibiotic exporter with double-glycine peptidase domain